MGVEARPSGGLDVNSQLDRLLSAHQAWMRKQITFSTPMPVYHSTSPCPMPSMPCMMDRSPTPQTPNMLTAPMLPLTVVVAIFFCVCENLPFPAGSAGSLGPPRSLSEDAVPTGPPLVRGLHQALDVARDPAAVVVTRRRMGALVVDVALPGPDMEGEIALEGLVLLGRLVVRPDAVVDDLGRRDGAHDGVIRGRAIELGEGGPRRGRERQPDPAGGDVVDYARGGRVSRMSNTFFGGVIFFYCRLAACPGRSPSRHPGINQRA